MNPARFAIRRKTTSLIIVVVLLLVGTKSYLNLGRLEDPNFTIKQAVVYTQYPGATAGEVESEVTEVLETEIQQLAQLKEVESRSMQGLSVITVSIKDHYFSEDLPQVWDELRRKVNAAQADLPPGAGPSSVNDDFGDVYGIFFALTGDGYSMAELDEAAKMLKKELLLVKDVAKVELYGERQECVFVEMSNQRMSQFGVMPESIYAALQQKNLVTNAGKVKVGSEYIAIDLTGDFRTADQIGNIFISSGDSDHMVRLSDVAEVKRGYYDPPTNMLRFDGKPAVGLGISITPTGNVVNLGQAVKKRLEELSPELPLGMEMQVIAYQSDLVEAAINGFLVNLAEAVGIVVVVLMIFMGLRSGVIIGAGLLLTICATFIVMEYQGINLQRISLGALVLALGMLVDNSIVIIEGMLIRIRLGMDREEAAAITVQRTALPLLGATAVAVLAFAALGLSNNSAGEFTSSLFYVMMYSLLLSWVLAITVTPVMGYLFLIVKPLPEGGDPYGGILFRGYRRFLGWCLDHRVLTITGMIILLALSLRGFGLIKQGFFTSATRPAFLVDYWLPQGTHIDRTSSDLRRLEDYILTLPNVTSVTTFVGQGSLRYYLPLNSEFPNSSYGQLKVGVTDYTKAPEVIPLIDAYARENFPDAQCITQIFEFGPGSGGKVRARFIGPDPEVLRALAGKAMDIMAADPGAKDIRQDWRERVKVLRPVIAAAQAERNGLGPAEIAANVREAFAGRTVGVYRDGDDLLPIVVRPPEGERASVDELRRRQIWSPAAGRMIPLTQVVSRFETRWEDAIIKRKDRKRTIEAVCDPVSGAASVLLGRVRPKIEAIHLSPGYTLEWGGEYEDSRDANESIFVNMPLVLFLMFLVVVALFDAIRQPIIIFLCIPLALIGVTAGFLLTGLALAFIAVLGVISLTGMLIKNSVVLIDEIDLQIREGTPRRMAVMDASVSRVRPVMMASFTTVLGMMPLLQDPFYQAMAVTIMSGLTFGTVLTLIVVPVLYTLFFRIRPEEKPVPDPLPRERTAFGAAGESQS